MRRLTVLLVILLPSFLCFAQNKEPKKYPALLWQITGNGLSKPSYLFGTMHVSSKMVFNLGDSFYIGIKNADVVALELNPQLWQDQMSRYQLLQNNLRSYSQGSPSDYLNEKSFQIEKYEDKLKAALSEEPTIINGLLYRTYQQRADFEEDTYLDLYIYQTGKKLGKQATGVENYFQTEKLIVEANQDMMKDKNKRNPGSDGESVYELEKKTEEAYRQGDLDLLDSLERIMQSSNAFMEKFLYRRNEIQANSIDSILKKHSLFVGVGAAHLPGKRGVIELLRQKGYQLRPISIQARAASEREEIDKIKVPVRFSTFSSDNGLFRVNLPGKLYNRPDSRSNESWQYADMANGAYYMVTTVKTYHPFLGQDQDTVLKKIDSLLYENIPGKILKKTSITRSGYKGFDITNKTRRGDIQRYNVIVTPFEVLVFKMSGTASYVDGEEADQFFNSIELKRADERNWVTFEPASGGFRVKLPETPFVTKNTSGLDGPRWEYESNDPANGDDYLILRKSLINYRFLDEDSILLCMMEESFGRSECIDKKTKTTYLTDRGRQVLQVAYKLKDGSCLKAEYFIKGPNYYVLAAHSRSAKTFSAFFGSFSPEPISDLHYQDYSDSFANFRVSTPIVPDIDSGMCGIFERATSEDFLNAVSAGRSHYWPHNKTAFFRDDSTGEAIYVSVERFPKYYYPKDTVSFWKDELNEKRVRENFIIRNKTYFHLGDSATGYQYLYADTGSSRFIHHQVFIEGDRLYRVISLSDSAEQSDFVRHFYETIRPLHHAGTRSVFVNKLDLFFHDFYSLDSATAQKAKAAIPNVYFGAAGLPRLLEAIENLPYNDKDYFDTKTKLISELGYISDSSVARSIVESLKTIYQKANDTSVFQNAVVTALAKNKARVSYALLKTLLLQDPPVFDNPSDYNYLFQDMGDSLELARSLFPEILQLSAVDDYRDNLRSLLTTLVDSNYLKSDDYSSYFNKIYFDAKIQLKKQRARDEGKLQKTNEYENRFSDPGKEDDHNDLGDYAILLLPFYDKNPVVPKFFATLLQSDDATLRLNTVILLLRHGRQVSDSIIMDLAKDDKYRFELYKKLDAIGKQSRFPTLYANQLDMARSALVASSGKSISSIEFVDKKLVQFKLKKGWVYFFKYKTKKEDNDWQMGISGLQPENLKYINTNHDISSLPNRILKKEEPLLEQFDKQLKHVLFSKYKSGVSFFLDNDYYINRMQNDDEN